MLSSTAKPIGTFKWSNITKDKNGVDITSRTTWGYPQIEIEKMTIPSDEEKKMYTTGVRVMLYPNVYFKLISIIIILTLVVIFIFGAAYLMGKKNEETKEIESTRRASLTPEQRLTEDKKKAEEDTAAAQRRRDTNAGMGSIISSNNTACKSVPYRMGCPCTRDGQCGLTKTCEDGICVDPLEYNPLKCSGVGRKPTGCACSNMLGCTSGVCKNGICIE
jgi:hypothetical protein